MENHNGHSYAAFKRKAREHQVLFREKELCVDYCVYPNVLKSSDAQKGLVFFEGFREEILANGLKNAATLDFTKEEVEAAIDALGKGASVRGETLTLEEFARLSDLLSPYKKG